MITLKQIRTLESRVKRAVSFMEELRVENRTLKERLESYQKKIEELEALVLEYKQDQKEIETGILNAIDHLNRLEDRMSPPEAEIPESAAGPVDELEDEPLDEAADTSRKEAELDIF